MPAETDHIHVEETDLKGNVSLSPEQEAVLADVDDYPGWRPTRKWWGLLVSGLASIVASWIVTGVFDDVERGMLGTLIVTLGTTYIVTNEPTPGGVPPA